MRGRLRWGSMDAACLITQWMCRRRGVTAMAKITGGSGNDNLIGTNRRDKVYGDTQKNLQGTQGGNDIIDGVDGNDELIGDAGRDIKNGATGGIDTLQGGTGRDRVYGDARRDISNNSAGAADTIDGGQGNDKLYGDAGDEINKNSQGANDVITDLLGNNSVYGDAGGSIRNDSLGGNDDINTGDGNDAIHADAGNDIYDHSQGGDDTIDAGDGDNTVTGDAKRDVEKYSSGGDDDIRSGDGDDVLIGDAGDDIYWYSDGGNDLLRGGLGRDLLVGDAGDDISYHSQGGNDTLYAGNDADPLNLIHTSSHYCFHHYYSYFEHYYYMNKLYGDAQDDITTYSYGGNDVLYGSDASDYLVGDAGGNIKSLSHGGDDEIYGGGGNDYIVGDAGSRIEFYSTGGNDRLFGQDGDDVIIGDAKSIRLWSQGGDDLLQGGRGNDLVYGNDGDDTAIYDWDLNNGPGLDAEDYYSGGDGDNDTLLILFSSSSDTANIQAGINAYLAFLATNPSDWAVFDFAPYGFDLKVRSFESIDSNFLAVDDANSTMEEPSVNPIFGDVTSNDFNPLNNSLSVIDVDGTSIPAASNAVISGIYGDLTINSDGTYDYQLRNADLNVQALAGGEVVTDTFSYTVTDGAFTDSALLTISITGTEDDPIISGVNNGNVAEDGTLSVSDSLTVNDLDFPDNPTFTAQTNSAGTYGLFSIDNSGNWSYSLSNAAVNVQGLAGNESVSDSFVVEASTLDGEMTSETVTITIQGEEDAPVISGVTTGNVAEDGTLVASASLAANDLDSVDNPMFVVQTGTTSTYGSFSIDAVGNWTYTLDNDAAQSLQASQTVNESFVVTASTLDGESVQETVTISITGKNDAPTALALDSNDIDENAPVGTLIGTFSTVDVDNGDVYHYTLSATDIANGFSIDLTSGALSSTTAFDFELVPSYVITVTTTDQAGTGLSYSDTFTITVNDVFASLFTNNDDNVDFADLLSLAPTEIADIDPASFYNALNGNDIVVLSDSATAATLGVVLTTPFAAGLGNDEITGADDVDNIILGEAGNDIIYGGGGSNTLDGGADVDTVSYAGATDAFKIDLVHQLARVINTLTYNGIEPNESQAQAMDLDQLTWNDPNDFPDPNVENPLNAPYISIFNAADPGGLDFYKISVASGGVSLSVDLDFTTNDGNIEILDALGARVAFSEDNSGDPGSLPGQSSQIYDPRLTTVLPTAGDYYIRIGEWQYPSSIPTGAVYTMHVALEGHTVDTPAKDTLLNFENVIGGEADDLIVGDSNVNRLEGRGGSDKINAGQGDDTVLGGDGDNVLDGGSGIDTLSYEDFTTSVNVNLSTGSSTHTGTDTFANFENVTGGAAADIILDDSSNNVIRSAGGDDVLQYDVAANQSAEDSFDGGDGTGDTLQILLDLNANGGLVDTNFTDILAVIDAYEAHIATSASTVFNLQTPALVMDSLLNLNAVNIENVEVVLTNSTVLDNNAVIEDLPAGFNLIGTFTASSVAAGPFEFALVDDAGGIFDVDVTTGVLSTNLSLDFETQRQYEVTLQVTDTSNDFLFAPQTFTIDVIDTNDDGCLAATPVVMTNADGTGIGSLRDAIICANDSPDIHSVITLDALTYTLSLPGTVENLAATGDLDVTSEITIIGQGIGNTIIDAADIDRVFEVFSTGNLTLQHLTVTGGSISGSGGGIVVDEGRLVLDNVEITSNTASSTGGGIYAIGSTATLDITDSVIKNNETTLAHGGGVYLQGLNSAGAFNVNVVRSEITDNTAGSLGGGFYTRETTLSILDSTISDNQSGSNGGGLRGFSSGTWEIIGSTISGNTAGASGGAMAISGIELTLINSTLSGNSARFSGGAIFGQSGSSTDIANSTITLNDSLNSSGDGILLSGGVATLTSTIVAGNVGDVDVSGSTFTDGGNNLIGNSSASNIVANGTTIGGGLFPNVDPLLGALDDNGGTTLTHALLAGSPALDAGSNPLNLSTDQRGVAREVPVSNPDIGAVEGFAITPPTANADTAPPGVGIFFEGDMITIDVLANDVAGTNPIDPTTVDVVVGPSFGSISISASGEIEYSHDGSENFGDSFTYTVDDTSGFTSNTATVQIFITNVNDAPNAADDNAVFVVSGPTINIDLAGNDVDVDNALDLSSIVIIDQPGFATGSLTPLANGTVDYTHDGSANFSDSFTYTINDISGATSNIATVNIIVTNAPIAVDDSGRADTTLLQSGMVITNVASNDTDVDGLDLTSVEILSGPSDGLLINHFDGTITYTHNGTEGVLSDSYTYTIKDNLGAVSNVATVTLSITDVNVAPVVQNSTITAMEDGALVSDDLIADDFDYTDDANSLQYNITQQPTQGVATLTGATGMFGNIGPGFAFDPGSDFQDLAALETTTVTVEFTATDSFGLVSNTGVVTVTVTGINDAPVAQDGMLTGVVEDGPVVNGSLDADDIDSDDDVNSLQFNITAQPAQGLVTLTGAAGTFGNVGPGFSFDPGTDFQSLANGQLLNVTFDYTARDNQGAVSNTGTVTVTVTGVNDAPLVNAGADQVYNEFDVVNLNGSFTDVDSIDSHSVSWEVVDSSGNVVFTDNVLNTSFTPVGVDSFIATLTVNDGTIQVSDALTLETNTAPFFVGPTQLYIHASDLGGDGDLAGIVLAQDNQAPAQSITYSITGGADQALFEIDPANGLLSVLDPVPGSLSSTDLSAGLNNVYDIQVTASDGNLSASQSVSVTVGDCSLHVTTTADNNADTATVSLRDAIHCANNDSLTPGADIIVLEALTYFIEETGVSEDGNTTGDFDILSEITIIGQGIDQTIINAQSLDRVFDVTATGASLTLKNLTLLNGDVISTGENGGAIRLDNGNILVLDNVKIMDSTADQRGGAIAAESNSSVDIDSSQFIGNSVIHGSTSAGGGAIYLESIQGATIDDTLFQQNSAVYGGAVYHRFTNTDATYTNVDFVDNSASGNGGAIAQLGGYSTLIDSTATLNDASVGGVVWSSGGSLTTINSDFIDNASSGDGAVVWGQFADIYLLEGSTFTNNVAGSQAGVMYTNRGIVEIDGALFDDNASSSFAGALAINDPDEALMITNSTFTHHSAANGGVISLNNVDKDVTIDNVNFSDNLATTDGGVLYLNSVDNLMISNSTLSGNDANRGGAIFSNSSNVSITDSTIASNDALTSSGGGIYSQNSGQLALSTVSLVNNTAAQTGGGLSIGGTTNFSVSNSTISSNTANGNGGGVSVQDSATGRIANSTITANDATGVNVGSGINQSGSSALTLVSSIVAGNIDDDINGSVIDGGNNFTSGDPDLGPLQDNGGEILTHLPNLGSPVIDGGANPDNLDTDQRGAPREQGSQIDIGATEVGNTLILEKFVDGNIADSTLLEGPTVAVVVGDSALFRYEVTNYSNTLSFTFSTATNPDDLQFSITDDNGAAADFTVLASDFVSSTFGDTDALGTLDPGETWAFEIVTAPRNANENETAATLTYDNTSDAVDNDTAHIDLGVYSDGYLDDGSASSLRQLITDANLNAGADVINLVQGTYFINIVGRGEELNATGDFDVTENLTIQGAVGAEASTIIDANTLDRIFQVHAGATLTLKNLTLVNGSVSDDNDNGGAVRVENTANLIIDNVIFKNNAARDGGAIWAQTGNALDIDNALFENNLATDEGGALYLSVAGDDTIDNSQFINNTANSGGAVDMNGGATAIFTNVDFIGNETINSGGAINAQQGRLFIDGALFDSNSTTNSGGAIRLESSVSDASITNANFSNNMANFTGGAFSSRFAGNIIITDSTFTDNSLTDSASGRGAGIYIQDDSQVIIRDVVVDGNSGSNLGGGIYAARVRDLTISDSTVSGNSTSSSGSGIYIESGSDTTLSNITLDANIGSITGGGLSVTDGSVVNANRLIVTNNEANTAGGIAVDNSTLILSNATIANNGTSSSGNGGGIHLTQGAVLDLSNSTVSHNTAMLNGAGIYVNDSQLTVGASTISSNVAQGNGGGILLEGDASAQVANTTITLNDTVSGTGSGISNQTTADDLILSSTIVSGNIGDDLVGGSVGSSNFIGGSANLGPLQANGGLTETHVPNAGSPVIDAGNNLLSQSIDQRGAAREQGAAADVGAVEVGDYLALEKFINGNVADTALIEGAAVTVLLGDTALFRYEVTNLSDDILTYTENANPGDHEFTLREDNGTGADIVVLKASFVASDSSDVDANATFDPGDTWVFEVLSSARNLGENETQASVKVDFVVNGSDDDVIITDAGIYSEGFADDGSAGSLRALITAANATVGTTETISLSQGTYLIEMLGAFENANASGDFDITDSLIIEGALGSEAATIIDASGLDRIFDVFGAGVTLTLRNVTLTGGDTTVNNESGGAILTRNDASLVLENVIVENNLAHNIGGAIFNNSNGSIDITDSQFLNNATTGGGFGFGIGGGAISNTGSGSVMTIDNSHFEGNYADYSGGAIHLNNNVTLTLTDSHIVNNRSDDDGGGIYIYDGATVNISNSVISGNYALSVGANGGGIANREANLTISDSIVSNNISTNSGGGYYQFGDLATSDFDRVAVNNNTTTNGTGGGFYLLADGSLDITNSTISSNYAEFDGGAIYVVSDFVLTIENSTLVDNIGLRFGNAIYTDSTVDILMTSSLVGSSAASVNTDDFDGSGNFDVASDYNLIEDITTAPSNLTSGANTISGVDAAVAALADNGGFGLTNAIETGSQALNNGANPASLAEDGRGALRDDGAGVDIGAFELQTSGLDGDNTIVGTLGDDILHGYLGDDIITGDNGNDILSGDAGSDDFVFAPGDGADIITDFNAFDDNEDIDLTAYSTSLSNVLAATEYNNGDVIIDLEALGGAVGDQLTLESVNILVLDANDFLF